MANQATDSELCLQGHADKSANLMIRVSAYSFLTSVMYRCEPRFILAFIVSLFISNSALAVSEERLWLPKKYRNAKPYLLESAQLAEQSKRCQQVVAGKMLYEKTTATDYYFVITCRDETRKTYNISYSYPRSAEVSFQGPVLVGEQTPNGEVAAEEVLTAVQAEAICREQLTVDAALLGRPSLPDKAEQQELNDRGFLFTYTFEVRTIYADAIRYQAHCEVSWQQEINIYTQLQPEGALALCQSALREESVLLKSIRFAEQPSQLHRREGHYDLVLPFEADESSGKTRQYLGFCEVSAEGEATSRTELDKVAIVPVCINSVERAASKMRGVKILTQQVSVPREVLDEVLVVVPFNAADPSGKTLRYEGHCEVDKGGRSRVDIKVRR